MNRDIWGRDRDDPRRMGRDIEPDRRDFGQADYSQDYGYDAESRTGYRVDPRTGLREDYDRADGDRDYARDPALRGDYRRDETRHEPRTFEGGSRRDRRRASHDRVIWAVICERLDRARGLDVSNIDVRVENGVVFLEGVARNRKEKRRAEELAETEGVADVVNALRIRGHTDGDLRRSSGF